MSLVKILWTDMCINVFISNMKTTMNLQLKAEAFVINILTSFMDDPQNKFGSKFKQLSEKKKQCDQKIFNSNKKIKFQKYFIYQLFLKNFYFFKH